MVSFLAYGILFTVLDQSFGPFPCEHKPPKRKKTTLFSPWVSHRSEWTRSPRLQTPNTLDMFLSSELSAVIMRMCSARRCHTPQVQADLPPAARLVLLESSMMKPIVAAAAIHSDSYNTACVVELLCKEAWTIVVILVDTLSSLCGFTKEDVRMNGR